MHRACVPATSSLQGAVEIDESSLERRRVRGKRGHGAYTAKRYCVWTVRSNEVEPL